jgi:hypothetical protein
VTRVVAEAVIARLLAEAPTLEIHDPAVLARVLAAIRRDISEAV